MKPKPHKNRDRAIQAALQDLQQLILTKYPDATFQITDAPDDPGAIDMWTFVDLEDTEEVLDLTMDRELEYNVEQHLPVHVMPLRRSVLG